MQGSIYSREDVLAYISECMNLDHSEIEVLYDSYMKRNVLILKYLTELKKIYKRRKDKYREQAYSTAVDALKRIAVPILSGKHATSIRGVGKSIASKIDEIIKTGKLETVDVEMTNEIEQIRTLEVFTDVHGIGIVKAKDLYNKGYRKLDEIPLNELTKAQRIGVKYYEDFKLSIPREEVESIEYILKRTLTDIDNEALVAICGSYRRGKERLGDIDVLISSKVKDVLKRYVQALHKIGILVDDLSTGYKKYMGVATLDGKRVGRRIDIRLIPHEEWATGLLYFTGSKAFNISMRRMAIDMGMTLNEYGLFKGNTRIPTPTEESVFDALQISYVDPSRREYSLSV